VPTATPDPCPRKFARGFVEWVGALSLVLKRAPSRFGSMEPSGTVILVDVGFRRGREERTSAASRPVLPSSLCQEGMAMATVAYVERAPRTPANGRAPRTRRCEIRDAAAETAGAAASGQLAEISAANSCRTAPA